MTVASRADVESGRDSDRVELLVSGQRPPRGSYFERIVAVAVVSVSDLRINGDRAEIDMGLWCGSLCGTWFTYEAERAGETWRILGTTGPIAVS